MKETEVYILLGGNLGDVMANFDFALQKIQKLGEIMQRSSVYKTEPWGMQSENVFLNQAILLKTDKPPTDLLEQLQRIEQNFARETSRNGNIYLDRYLDLDILFYGNQVINTKTLMVPHPKLHLRKFTLQPLGEIIENFAHPIMHKTIQELLQICDDNSEVTIYEG